MGRMLCRRDFLRLGASASGALALAACGDGGGPRPRSDGFSGLECKVGVILPASGPDAATGDSVRRGMQLYLEQVGHRGGGRTVAMADADEGAGDPSVALDAARRLVEREGVELLAGILDSASALAVRDYAHQRRVPTLVAGAGADSLGREGRSPFVYRASYSNWQLGQPMGRVLAGRGIRRLALVCADGTAGREVAAALKETYTGQVLAEIRTPSPNPSGDFGSSLTQIAGVRPDAVYVFLAGANAAAFLEQARAALDPAVQVTGVGFLVEPDVLAAVGGAAPAGAVTGLHWATALDSAENRVLTSGFRAAFGRAADLPAVHGYDAARVIVEALDAARGRTDDRPAFMRAIAGVRFKSPRGDFRFDARSHNVVNTLYVRQVVSDPALGWTNRVIGSVAGVADPGR